MSWHCSLALVEEFSDLNCLGTESCAQLRSIRTAEKSFYDGKKTGYYSPSPSGMTLQHLMVNSGLVRWISCLAVSRAKTYHAPEKEQGLKENDPDFGEKWQESSTRFDLDTCSLRTAQCLERGASKSYSKTLPFWGLMRNGIVYQRRNAKRPIDAIVSGFWPTPTVHVNHNKKGASKNSGDGRNGSEEMANTASERPQTAVSERIKKSERDVTNTSRWPAEPDVGRVAHGVARRVDRLKAIGNGQVPRVVKIAWELYE